MLSRHQCWMPYLVDHEGLDLALEDLHSCCGDNGADVRHHALTENFADEAVVSLESGGGRVLHGKAIVVIWNG